MNLKTLKTTFRNLLTWICFEYKVKVWCPEMGCEVCWWLVAAMGGGCTGRHSTTGDCWLLAPEAVSNILFIHHSLDTGTWTRLVTADLPQPRWGARMVNLDGDTVSSRPVGDV